MMKGKKNESAVFFSRLFSNHVFGNRFMIRFFIVTLAYFLVWVQMVLLAFFDADGF
jgi:hypothetical protein